MVYQYDNNNLVATYENVSSAARSFGVDESIIRRKIKYDKLFRGYKFTKFPILHYTHNKLQFSGDIFNPLKVKSSNGNTLVISDLHLPFTVNGAIEFCKDVCDRFNCGDVVFIGDALDNHAISFHDHDADGMSASDEFNVAIMQLQEWYKAFPVAYYCLGNHDQLPYRQAFKSGLPKGWLKDFKDVIEAPSAWRFAERFIIDNVVYEHGTGKSGDMAAVNAALKHRQSYVMGHAHCVPVDYEVLTESRGFIKITDVELGERIYGYENNSITLCNVNDKIKESYSGEIYKFNSCFSRQEMTSNHKIYTKDGKYIPINEAVNILSPNDLVKTAIPIDTYNYKNTYNDDILRMIVAFCADGSYNGYDKNTPQVRFHLKKDRKINRLNEIIKNLGYNIEWTKTQNNTFKSKQISVELRNLLKKYIPDKILPEWFLFLSEQQRQVVIDELKFWNGCNLTKDNSINSSYQFSSFKPKEIDIIQQLLLMNGILSRRLPNKTSTITFDSKKEYLDKNHLNRYVEKYSVIDKDMACLSTSTNNFFVRTTDGTIELTGNSFGGVRYLSSTSDTIFGMNVGCLVNEDTYAMAYGRFMPNRGVVGCGVVADYGRNAFMIIKDK